MALKPWRELAVPHKDVLEGTFKQSEFAADITQVAMGTAPAEYKTAEMFFSRTYITEGMRLLLISVAQRLASKGGDPVVQLQTSFGGGKTHAMIAVYHLAKQEAEHSKMNGIPAVLDQAGIHELPKAKIAVIDGINLSPSEPKKRGPVTVNTLWGELAWQLLGEPGYKLVEKSDVAGTSPGKEVLVELLKKAAPCVLLMDELVAYIRNFESGKSFTGGTFESNMSFIQALTEALKAVPNAILLASLPQSETESVGSLGKLALETLEKYFGRVESVWKPVGTEESFEIVKRRLFESFNRAEIEKVCRTFFDYYIENNNKFPAETQTSHYLERLIQSYPIHPEVFDRLYEDWSTLDKFQRTRGVLQYLAIVIHRLWNSENRDPIIMPGSIPLDDINVRTKSIHYLPQGWEPIIESEIDGIRSHANEIDAKEPKFGAIQAARRVARTVFLGSAPANYNQQAKGVALAKILLGACQPGQVVGTYEDVLKRLRDKLQYLFSDNERYWFDTRPNLRREMESRKQRINYVEHILPAIRAELTSTLKGGSSFSGIHVFSKSEDVPDEIGSGPRLVVFEPDSFSSYSKANTQELERKATEFLKKRGEQPRQRQNRLIFYVPDSEAATRLKENAKTYLAWDSIAKDIDDDKLNLDVVHIKQAKKSLEDARKVFVQSIRETYKWLMNPFEELQKGKPELKWEYASVNTSLAKAITAIEAKLKEEEWMIFEWAPIHLANTLKQWYFKDGNKEVSTRKIFNDMASYIYLPRLLNEEVFKNAIEQGIMVEDFFGFAQGKEGEKYLGLTIGGMGKVHVDEVSLLIKNEVALEEKAKQHKPVTGETSSREPTQTQARTSNGSQTGSGNTSSTTSEVKQTRFFASTEITPQKARLDFNQILEEVLMHLTSRSSSFVSINIEINAVDSDGFEEGIQRTLKENCNSLGFKQFDFSKE